MTRLSSLQKEADTHNSPFTMVVRMFDMHTYLKAKYKALKEGKVFFGKVDFITGYR